MTDYQQLLVGLEKGSGFTPIFVPQNIQTLSPYTREEFRYPTNSFRQPVVEGCCGTGGYPRDMYFGVDYAKLKEGYTSTLSASQQYLSLQAKGYTLPVVRSPYKNDPTSVEIVYQDSPNTIALNRALSVARMSNSR